MATTIEVLLKNGGAPSAAGQTGAGSGGNKLLGSAGGSTGPPKPTADTPILKKMFGGIGKFVKGQLGLNFGVGALLKQSQIFTSTIGVIFQLLGALVDVMLAPLLPLIIPFIRLLGRLIPKVQQIMNAIVAPAILAIVEWGKKFFGSWSGFGEKIFGAEGLGGLWSNFTGWFTGTASPWMWEKLKDVRDYVGQKLVDMWDWFKGTDTRVKGWIITFFVTQFARIPKFLAAIGKIIWHVITLIPKIIVGILKLGLRLIGFFSKISTFFIKMMVGPLPGKIITGIRKFIVLIIKSIWNVATFILKPILGLGRFIVVGIGKLLLTVGTFILKGLLGLGSFILKGVMKLPALIYKGALSLISMVMKGLGGVLGKLPFIGGKIEKMLGGVSNLVDSAKNPKKLVEGIGKKLGGGRLVTAIGGMAKLSKAIPVVGALATAGFGAFEVGKAVAQGNYAKAGMLATKTVAATALTGVGMSAAGLAVDVGGTLAANALFKKAQNGVNGAVAAGGTATSPYGPPGARGETNVTVELSMKDEDGRTTSSSIQELKAKDRENERFAAQFANEGAR